MLRDYQLEAVDSVFGEWQKVNSTIGIAATGSGKTEILCEIIRRSLPARAMVLAHRTELVSQAVHRLEKFGMEAEIEKADMRASHTLWNRSPVVVATPQTLYGRNFARLQRFKPEDFSILIADEAHHYVGAKAFEGVVKHFKQNPRLKVLGVTATPDRHDSIALSRIFDTVAFNIEIVDLIKRGYLVDIEQQVVKIESLDFSKCRKVAGDLHSQDLAEVMEYEKTMLGVADATLRTVGAKKAIVFATSVKQAERLTEIFNRHKPNCADCVFGHTPDDDRDEIVKRFSTDKLQICVNVGCLIEGYDNPKIEAVVMAAPTLSRSRYAQCIGRGTRPLPGVVNEEMTDEERKLAISFSTKPNLTVLDFVGNSGRHSLCTPADILGGIVSEEARELAKKRVQAKGGGNVLNELAIAEKELKEKEEAAKRSGIRAEARFKVHYVDPFAAFKKRAEYWKRHQQTTPLSEKQKMILLRKGHNPDEMTPQEGQALITKLMGATDKQKKVLLRAGYKQDEVDCLQVWDASKLIDKVAKNGWKKPDAEVPRDNEVEMASADPF